MTIGRLHVITPSDITIDDLDALDATLAAGASVVQIRLKDRTDRDRLTIARRIRARCRRSGTTCIIDDRADLALAVDADGVHVGADDLPVEVVRGMLGPSAIVGGTCRNPEDARRAELAGATYLGAGPVYTSSTKAGLPDPMGPAGIAAIAAAVTIPVIAISGVTIDRVPELLDAGAHGVAVIAAVFDAPDPARATTDFLTALAAADHDATGRDVGRSSGRSRGPSAMGAAT